MVARLIRDCKEVKLDNDSVWAKCKMVSNFRQTARPLRKVGTGKRQNAASRRSYAKVTQEAFQEASHDAGEKKTKPAKNFGGLANSTLGGWCCA
jgi:hypothetical protein